IMPNLVEEVLLTTCLDACEENDQQSIIIIMIYNNHELPVKLPIMLLIKELMMFSLVSILYIYTDIFQSTWNFAVDLVNAASSSHVEHPSDTAVLLAITMWAETAGIPSDTAFYSRNLFSMGFNDIL
ncbi:hypothetical protein ACJX0J_008544, partial [Zea mays]